MPTKTLPVVAHSSKRRVALSALEDRANELLLNVASVWVMLMRLRAFLIDHNSRVGFFRGSLLRGDTYFYAVTQPIQDRKQTVG